MENLDIQWKVIQMINGITHINSEQIKHLKTNFYRKFKIVQTDEIDKNIDIAVKKYFNMEEKFD